MVLNTVEQLDNKAPQYVIEKRFLSTALDIGDMQDTGCNPSKICVEQQHCRQLINYSPLLVNYDGMVAVSRLSSRVAITMKLVNSTTTDIFLLNLDLINFYSLHCILPTDEVDVERWNELISNDTIDSTRMELYSVDISGIDANLTTLSSDKIRGCLWMKLVY
uniref:Uncharacterized protein n=1 Tax=Ditylenchus dipsaci TaxID=166011 RepID=A0A915CUS8_9BILA